MNFCTKPIIEIQFLLIHGFMDSWIQSLLRQLLKRRFYWREYCTMLLASWWTNENGKKCKIFISSPLHQNRFPFVHKLLLCSHWKKKSKKEKKYFEKSNQAYIRKEKKRRKKKKILLTHKKMLLGTHLKKGSGTSQTCRCQLKLVLENEMWASVRARTQCVNEKC